ncbi:TPA: hypothetical protein DEO28_01045 [Candidatus Dependentiae bacterium]|nr:MAG: hypothetical protein UR14_C0003G0061 [candidate division TM6 bacterium GW2011_GWE2_31_21]KKP53775.1 MAG: hypothetical protein UR43_C0003G0096 [candidate division TM6 bacterium GW2011_GWF2_33_332]HBS48471.1 hypothetical protein [Candidatus Dependentiae bacterium]HBZ73086.1 hypothetical protein [Candidatus Dependentiae bacterium]
MWNSKKLPKSIYIHYPFCIHKCTYCDFLSFEKHDSFAQQYHNALCNEITSFSSLFTDSQDHQKIKTIYIGGGTPSIYPKDLFADMVKLIDQKFDISNLEEFTIEANPHGLTEDRVKLWKDLGINRVSLGVQILNDQVLAEYNRFQTRSDVLHSIDIVSKHFDNITVDLILGFSQISQKEWMANLQEVVTWPIKHISIYLLTIYENTQLFYKIKNKELEPKSDEELIDTFEKTIDFLKANGFLQYEISNFAKKGFESKHNLVYWDRESYVGLGLGAASFDGESRSTNLKNLQKYLQLYKIPLDFRYKNEIPFQFYSFTEELDEKKKKNEKMMLGLRKTSGVELRDMVYFLSMDDQAVMLKKINFLKELGLIHQQGQKISLTFKGMMLEEEIILTLM